MSALEQNPERTASPHGEVDAATTEMILAAVAGLSFGAVEVTVHDGRVVQIDRRERIRIPPPKR